MDIYTANDWFANIVLAPHRAKLQQARSRTSLLIEQKEKWLGGYSNVPNMAHAVGATKAELVKLKAKLTELDTRLAQMWQSPQQSVLDKMQQLYNKWTHYSTQAGLYANYAERNLNDEKPIAAKNDADQSAEYRKIADAAKKELDALQKIHRVPDGPDDAAKYGFVEFIEGGQYRVIL